MDENEKIKKSPKTSNKKKKRQKSRVRPVSTDDDPDDSDYVPILDDDDITKDNKAYLEFLRPAPLRCLKLLMSLCFHVKLYLQYKLLFRTY